MSAKKTRIYLLSDAERDDLYARPQFNKEERRHYFHLNKEELEAVKHYKNINTRLYFILQLGYFKATQQFYDFTFDDVKADCKFIFQTYFQTKPISLKGQISRPNNQKQKDHIIQFFEYHSWSDIHRSRVELHVCELLRTHPNTHNAFRELLVYFEAQRIVIPSYRTLQDIFTMAFVTEQRRISDLVLSFPKNLQRQLEELIHQEEGLMTLHVMRTDQKDFQYTALRLEVEKAQSLSELYLFCKAHIPTLKLSKNTIRYYAEIADHYAPSRLRHLNKAQQLLHVICFVYHRYQEFMDNMIITFTHHVRAILDSGKAYADMAFLQHSSKLSVDFPKLAQFLKWFPNQEKTPDMTYDEFSKKAYSILPKQQFEPLATFIEGNSFDKKAAKWEYYRKSFRMLALYLRPIFLAVDFEFHTEDKAIIELTRMLKKHYSSGKTPSSLKFTDELGLTLPKGMIPYLKSDSHDPHLDPYLLEFFIYQRMYHHFERGRMFCNNSVSFGDLDNDLVPDEWVDNVESTAQKFGYSKIPIYCDSHLDHMVKKLDMAWDVTLKNIDMGRNQGIQFTQKKGRLEWNLLYDAAPVQQDVFFKNLPQIEIGNLVKYIGDMVNIWKSFTHSKNRYVKRKDASPMALIACILAEAFGVGAQKMSDMSDLDYGVLRSISQDFMHMGNLANANDVINNYIYSLPIFKLWCLMDCKVLADADGQKFSTSHSTIQSRYSKKYLGKGKGISLYTLLANFVAVNAKNIGLNEYEGHSLYDMVYGNTTDIPIDMVTGDNHSLNQLNFMVLDSIDVEYVPSIKNIRYAADELYSVKNVDSYSGFIKPKGQINVHRITSEKRGILRVLLSLLVQENTQSTIIRKLNSHSRYARLRAALVEYNNIFKSIHVLNLINNMKMRKAIKTARNRTESYHQFQSLIRKVYHGSFRGKTIVDNRISAQASRCIANLSVAYNATLLNELYVKMLETGAPQSMIDRLARISPIAWSHISFTGKYTFKKSDGQFDFEKTLSLLEDQMKKYTGEMP